MRQILTLKALKSGQGAYTKVMEMPGFTSTPHEPSPGCCG